VKTIGIAVHTKRPLIRETTDRIVELCKEKGIKCYICAGAVKLVDHADIIIAEEEVQNVCEAVITLGGDGSILASARLFGKYGIPMLGINLGKFGFLTEVAPDQIGEAFLRLKDNQFKIEERMLLEIVLSDGRTGPAALNDVVIDHGDQTRLAKIDLFSNGEFVCPYDADGIIIATPTGSTAYSLSAGGPIIDPVMDAITVSPVSPHTLTLRSMIFPADNVLTVRSGSQDMNLRITLDGQIVAQLKSGEDITVRKANYKVKLIKFESKSFYEVLRTKLHWGARPLFNA
jgi:NAD+ kinase